MSNNCFCFWGTAKLFSRKTAFFIPTSNVWGLQFLHILANCGYCPLFFFGLAILLSVKRHFIVILTCISIVINDVEPFFHYAYWPFVYFLSRNVYSNPLCNLKIFFFFSFCWVIVVLYIFWILDPYQIYYLQILSLILWVVFFYFLDNILWNIYI